MPELKERFRAVDGFDAPELWAEARRRAATPEAPPRAIEWPPGAARRVAIGALAFAVFAVAIAFAWDLANPDLLPAPTPAPAAVDLAAELPVGWSELPPPPEVRDRAVTAWTGSQLIIWGGSVFDGGGDETPANDGFVFDGVSRSWSELPADPLSSRSDAAGVWTGQELLIWGGYTGACCDPAEVAELFLDDGAAFDPATGSWRSLPPAPLEARAPFSAWTGDELIVWGSRDRSNRARDGAAYDPSTDSWRIIAEAPIEITDGSAIWTGDEMIVFGAALDGNNRATTAHDIGAAYDPATDSWRRIPDSTLSPQAATASWAGDEMIAWDYELRSAAYDPVVDTWRPLPHVPIPFSECYPHSVSIPGSVLGDFCGKTVLFSTTTDRWDEITRSGIEGWVVEQAAAGSAYLVMAHPLELSEVPNRTFATKMFAYVPSEESAEERPSGFVPDAGFGEVETRMPLVFPDGSQATLIFPRELGLEELGVQPNVSYLWRDDPPPRFPIIFIHGQNAPFESYVEGEEPVGTVDSDSHIEVWKMSKEWSEIRQLPEGHWLRLRLPSWTVLVALERPELASDVAANLVIRETEGGFPVAEAAGPIALSSESGEGEGPSLAIGSTLDPSVFLWVERCTGPDQAEGQYGSICLADGRVTAQVYGRRGAVQAIVDGVRVEDLVSPT
jgi:hypothetical protein